IREAGHGTPLAGLGTYTTLRGASQEIHLVQVALWHRGHMDEHQLPDGQLAAIFLEGAYRHEQALAACLEEVGDLARLEDGDSRQLLGRALLHAERAAACAADAA